MTTDSPTYNVVINGKIRTGYEPEIVAQSFAKLFKVSLEKATAAISSKRTLKKGVDEKLAKTYESKLRSIGLEVSLEKVVVAPAQTEQPTEPKQNTVDSSASANPLGEAAGLALMPMDGEVSNTQSNEAAVPASPQPSDTRMTCPKCGLEQPKAEECAGCGIFVNKVKTAAQTNNNQEKNDNQTSPPKPRLNQKIIDDEPSAILSNPVFMLIAPAIAALLGALLWYFIGKAFDYELGLIAWLIGGAIGFAAAMTGARGTTTAVACAALVVVSIFGGKFMLMSSYKAQAIAALSESTGLDTLFGEGFSEAVSLIESDAGDDALRQFMFENDYAEGISSPSEIPDEYLEEFKSFVSEASNEQGDSSNVSAMYKESMDYLENLSTFDLVKESLGFMDILFLFFGMGTAFRLGLGNE